QEADRLTLIDAGLAGSAETIFGAVERGGARREDLAQVLVTHYHADHIGALAELAERGGARVLAHRLDAPVVRGEQEEAEPVLSDAERPYAERAIQSTPAAPRAQVDRELEDGDEIDLDGGARVVHVPGHTPGSIALYVPKRKLLFTGDAVAGVDGKPIVGVFNADPEQARASFRKLADLDFEVACFGHGAPLDRDASLAFRRAAERLG
ncbi:MAG: MBL fold metallo-hydrolase, partial [Dehalococcoidia bacterium]|nr:MBL fold metallo-hydrolase [Dehalococcoidia bacterium]